MKGVKFSTPEIVLGLAITAIFTAIATFVSFQLYSEVSIKSIFFASSPLLGAVILLIVFIDDRKIRNAEQAGEGETDE